MSLDVPAALLERAEAGEVSDDEFVECVRNSLPYAYEVVSRVAADLRSGTATFAETRFPRRTRPPAASCCAPWPRTPSAAALERHFGIKLAFQNCHRVAAFPLAEVGGETYTRFISTRAQLLNQSPELRNC